MNTTLNPELNSNPINQTVSTPVEPVQRTHQSTASDLPTPATTHEMSSTHEPSNGPSPLQGRDEVNYGGMPHHSTSLHGPAASTPHPFVQDSEVQQLRRIVASQQAQLASQQAQLASQNAQLFQHQQNFPALQYFPMAPHFQTVQSQHHAAGLNEAIKELEVAVSQHVPATEVPPLGTIYYQGFDLAERLRPGHFSRIGVVRAATAKLWELRAPPPSASNRRTERAARKTRPNKSGNPGASSLRTAPQVSEIASPSAARPASVQTPDNDPGDESEEDDWKGKGAAALRQPGTGKFPLESSISELVANVVALKSLSIHTPLPLPDQTLRGAIWMISVIRRA